MANQNDPTLSPNSSSSYKIKWTATITEISHFKALSYEVLMHPVDNTEFLIYSIAEK